jgi:hypothetical protein
VGQIHGGFLGYEEKNGEITDTIRPAQSKTRPGNTALYRRSLAHPNKGTNRALFNFAHFFASKFM